MKTRISVIVWNEFRHERENAAVAAIYPEGLHTTIAQALAATPGLNPGALPLEVSTATLDEAEHGLSEERLANCDVLVWWGHKVHKLVDDAIVDRVQKRVLEGMGLIVLHSGHFSKIFRRMMGTNCSLKWREAHSNAFGCPIWNVPAKSSSPAWRRIASTIFGRQCPALTHHRPEVPSRTRAPSAVT